jgi:hypothetical protein
MSRLNLTSWQRRRLRRQLTETLDARILRRTLAVLEFDQGRRPRRRSRYSPPCGRCGIAMPG